MALDWGILHWIQNNITCPFLDAVVPKLTMLGNAGIIWILAGVLLLCTKKYRPHILSCRYRMPSQHGRSP